MAIVLTNEQLKLIRTLLEAGVFAANVAVWFGVAFEGENNTKKRQQFGWRLLLAGLGLETSLGVSSYIANGILSNRQDEALVQQQHSNLKLQEKVAIRWIEKDTVPEQVLADINQLRGRPVRVASYSGDVEGALLASQILQDLAPEFKVEDHRLTNFAVRTVVFGVLVSGSDNALIDALMKFFDAAKIDAERALPPPTDFGLRYGSEAQPDVTIFVGAKPIKLLSD